MKIVIAIPQAYPLMQSTEEQAADGLNLYIQYGNQLDDSMEDVFYGPLPATGNYVSLKSGNLYPSVPTGASQVPTGSVVTLTQQ